MWTSSYKKQTDLQKQLLKICNTLLQNLRNACSFKNTGIKQLQMPRQPNRWFGHNQDHRNRQSTVLSLPVTKPASICPNLRSSQTTRDQPEKPEACFHGTSTGPIDDKSFVVVCKLKKYRKYTQKFTWTSNSVHSDTQRQ